MKNFIIWSLIFIYFYIAIDQVTLGQQLLLANQKDVRLLSLDSNYTRILANNLYQGLACDYIYQDNLVFWIDSLDNAKGRIQYVDLSDPHLRKRNSIVSGLNKPDGLACDWIGKKLYWTDAETNRIEVSELDGSYRKVLLWKDLDQPRAIALDPHKAYIYWTDWGEFPKIERAEMDGKHRRVLVKDNIYWPNGLTLDYAAGKVYWVEANFHFIHRMNMDGTQREEVLTQKSNRFPAFPQRHLLSEDLTTTPVTNVPFPRGSRRKDDRKPVRAGQTLQHPFAITLKGDWIYWTDWATDSIHATLKNGSGVPKVVKESGISPMDLQVYDGERQKPGTSPCNNNNGGCSHLCLLSPSSPFYSCACPTGVKILADNHTCEDGPNAILLFARRSDIRYISLDTPDYSDVLVPVDSARHAVAIDFDPVEKQVYWTDDGQRAILRAYLNGSGSELLISRNVEQADGIAVDWIGRNLYWTDTTRDYISVSRLNGSFAKVIIKTNIDEPRAIVLDPVAGHFYWSDWGKHPKIERANLDGSDRIILVDTDVMWPNGLALDLVSQILYWADAQLDRIEMIFLNGTGRKKILSGEIPHIFGLSYMNNYLYWTDWQRRRIEKMRVGSRRSRSIIADQLPDISGVKASMMTVQKGTNACAINNGGCSHLCLYTPKGPTCHCPSGLNLSASKRQCLVPEAFLLCSFTNYPGIRKLSLTDPRANTQIPFKQRIEASFLDFSIADDDIYWTDTKDMVIMRSNLNGSRVERFVDTGIHLLEGLAVDWIGRNVYWADSSTHRIEVVSMDKPVRKLLVWKNIVDPRCLALDPPNGFMYWSEWGNEPCIKKANMDGSNVVKITKGATGRPNSLTVDYVAQRLYWVDFDINSIMSSDVNGDNEGEIVRGSVSKSISSLAVYGDHVYWSDANRRVVERINKDTGNDIRVIDSHMNDVDDMTIYHSSRQVGVTYCYHDNGGCEHFCFSLPKGGHVCACAEHYLLQRDNRSCSPPLNFLLLSQTTFISRIIFQVPGSNKTVIPGRTGFGSRSRKHAAQPRPDAALSVRGLKDACAIDYDPIGRRVYWLDCKLSQIKSALLNGTKVRFLLRNTGRFRPFDFFLDPYTKLLFWTDLKSNSIKVMHFNGTMIGTVLSGTVECPSNHKTVYIMPRKIAIDPMKGRLYFSNACSDITSCRLSIIQSALDGSDCVVFFARNLHNVTAITVDREGGRLYWADKNRIESSTIEGSDRTAVDTGLSTVVGLAVFGQYLYYADARADDGKLVGINKKGLSKGKVIQSRVTGLRDLVSVVTLDEDARFDHPCSIDNGGCSHICVTNDDGTTRCSCPTHLTLIGEFVCGEPSPCESDQYTCRRKQQCIPKSWMCDGRKDCTDQTDEEGCSSDSTCGPGQFSCGILHFESDKTTFLQNIMEAKPQCIDVELVCNGKNNCINGKDEIDCPLCKNDEKLCSDGSCISLHKNCNICPGPSCNQNVDPQDNSFIIVIGIIFGCAVILGLVFIVRHCITNNRNPYPPGVVMFAPNSNGRLNLNVEFQAHEGSDPSRRIVVGGRKKQSSLNFAIVPPSNSNPSGSRVSNRSDWSAYQDGHLVERPSIPGASSSSSIKRHQANRRNSPSEVCNGDFACSSDSHSQHSRSYYRCKNGHRHRRCLRSSELHNPPPTPCTTDTCEDLEGCSNYRRSNPGTVPHEPPPPYFRHHSCCYHCCHEHNFHPSASSSGSGSSHQCGKPPLYESHRGSKRRHYHRRFVGANSDSDPCPPPPSPRSQYMSECCDTTEVEDTPDMVDLPEEEDSLEIKDINIRIADPRSKDDDNNDDGNDETDTLLESSLRRESPSITERSFSTLLDNPPPSPVTDSS